MNSFRCIAALFCLACLGWSRESGVIEGSLVDATGAVLVNTPVVLRSAGGSQPAAVVTTNERGEFSFTALPGGTYVVAAQADGFREAAEQVLLAQAGKAKVQITAQPAPEKLTVTVTGQRNATPGLQEEYRGIARLAEVSGVLLNTGKKNEVIIPSQLDANLALGNQRQVFAKVPGVNVWENDSSGVQLNLGTRGLSPNRSWEFNTRQNGYDISSDVLGYPEAYFTPPLESVERIEIVRGAGALQYGTQFGGLVNFVPKQAPSGRRISGETHQTFGSNGLFNTYNSLAGTVGRVSYSTYFHRRQGDGWRPFSGFNSNTGYGSLGVRLTERLTVRLELTGMEYLLQQPGGLTDAQFASNPRQSLRSRNWFNVRWFVPAVSLSYQASQRTKIAVTTFGLYGERNSIGNVNAPTTLDLPNTARRIDTDTYTNGGAEVRVIHTYNLFGRTSTVAAGYRYFQGRTLRRRGAGSTAGDADFRYIDPANLALDLRFRNMNHAAFVENAFRVTSRLTLTPGFRIERITTNGTGRPLTDTRSITRHVPLFGIGAAYRVTEGTELYANWTQAYRATTFNDIWRADPAVVVDPNLRDVNGANSDLGFRGRLGESFRFDTSLFLLQYRDRVGTVQRGTQQVITNVADSRNWGTEAFGELDVLRLLRPNLRWGSLTAFHSLGYVQAEYRTGQFAGQQVELAPRWSTRTGLTYARNGFSTTLQHTYTSEQYTNANNTRFLADGTQGLIPGYRVWDLAGTYEFRRYVLRAGVNNLADSRFFTRRATGYPGPGLVPADGRTAFIGFGLRF